MGLEAVAIEHSGKVCLMSIRALAAQAALEQPSAEGSGRTGWVHLAMAGRWEGHPSGAFEFSPEVFAQMVANFKKSKTPIKFDYEHQTMNGQPGPKPASGHVRDLAVRNNGQDLWGLVDWTPKAAELIKAGEYNYCSPVVAFRSIDKKTGLEHGAELLQVALTDDPFLDGQHRIQLSFTAAAPMLPDQKTPVAPCSDMTQPPPNQPLQPQGAPAMGNPPPPPPPPSAPPADVQMAEPPKPPEPPAPPDEGQADANALVDLIAEAAGGDRASVIQQITDNLEQVVAIIQKAIAKPGMPPAEKRQMSKPLDDEAEQARKLAALASEQKDAQIVALSKRLEAFEARMQKFDEDEAARKKAAVEKHVDDLIANGFCEQVKRDKAIWAFSTDPAMAKEIFSTKVVPIGVSQAGTESPAAAAPSASGEVKLDAEGVLDVRLLSKNQAVAFRALVDRYSGDQKRATTMFTKLNAAKGQVH